MGSSYVIPNVGTMASTGSTDTAIAALLQLLLLQSLGIDSTSPTAGYFVRIDWPVPGAPAWLITEDVAFIRVTEANEPYNAAHETQQDETQDVDGNYVESTIYTRVWDVDLIFYGPNSFDHARQVKACLYQDFFSYALKAANLYQIPVIGTARRAPELFENQWWPRTDFNWRMYEQVTDTLAKPSAASVEIDIADASGNGSVIVVQEPQQ